MLKNYFKVVEDFNSSNNEFRKDSDDVELLSVEKGEIIVDVKNYDDDWVIGKELVSQKMGKIPRKCIEMLNDNDGEESSLQRQQADSNSNRSSRGSSHENRLSSEEEVKTTPKDESNGGKLKAKAPKPPQAPPRLRKSRDVTEQSGSFRSRGSDEGYNSSSHYSGEKSSTSEPIVNPPEYDNANVSDIPLLSSFKESPNKLASPRPSITDAEGYEIPIFTPRMSVNGEVATGDEKGVTLKFIFNRTSTAFEEKSPEKFPLEPREKAALNSIGENSESIYETWSTDPKAVSPSSPRKKERREKIIIGVFLSASLLLSLGFFFLVLFVGNVTPLLCFTISVNIFAIFFIGFLTMENRRWLCIVSLLAPSLFSKKVKIAICLTLCVLIIAAPICNFSSNIEMVFRCKSLAVGKNSLRNTTTNAETLKVRAAVAASTPLPYKTKIVNQSSEINVKIKQIALQVKNTPSNVPRTCEANFGGIKTRCVHQNTDLHQTCIEALNTALANSLDANCTAENISCMNLIMQPRIRDICGNFSVPDMGAGKPLAMIKRVVIDEKNSFDAFRNTLLQLLPLLLLLVLHEAYQYNRDYLSNKEMDNVYITGKLKALDCERKERGMRNKLFPLRKLEFRKYVLPSFFLQTSRETKAVLTWLVIWLILGLSVLIIVFLDKYIYTALVFLYEDAKSSRSCDIKFKEMDVNIIYSLSFVLALLLIAVLIQSYVLRARSRICSFFYPKSESARGVYLYHKILHERLHFWKACRERGCTLSEARRTRWQIGIGHRIFRVLPASVQSVMEKLFVYRCMICDSLTCRKTFICKDQQCFATFCYECYIDMGQTCISCRPSGMRDSVFTSV